MRWVLVVVAVLHGLLHLLGFAKAFGLASLPQLTTPISRAMGLAWLLATVLWLASALLLAVAPRVWFWVGALALVVSQVVIVSSWSDARFGTLPNALLLAGVVYGFLSQGPASFRARYEREVGALLAASSSAPAIVVEQDLASLPPPVAAYLRRAGVLGRPRARSYRAHWRGRIRSSATAPWMKLDAEQTNFVSPPARFFYMDASLFGVAIDGLHRYVGDAAAMDVRALSLVRVAHAAGSEITRAETVTLLNDMCVLAPSTLLEPSLRWEPVDAQHARVTFTNAGHTVSAELVFDAAGDLVDFVSDDRSQATPDGQRQLRWSTPLRDYRAFGSLRLASRGEACWHPPEGKFAYIELELLEQTTTPA